MRQADEDWLAHGLDGRSPKTIKKNQNVLEPILKVVGTRKLHELSAADVRQALATMAAGYSSAAVTMGHLALKRAIRHAEASDLVSRNVAALVDTPKGQARPAVQIPDPGPGDRGDHHRQDPAGDGTPPRPEGRPRSGRADARLHRAEPAVRDPHRGGPALHWHHVDLDSDPGTRPPVPPHVAVWRSVRGHGETKTERSRRTLGLPHLAVEALRGLRDSQADERLLAGDRSQHTRLVFTTHLGTALDAGNVRKTFKRVCAAAGIGDGWTPRELRTSFVRRQHRGDRPAGRARLHPDN